MNNWILATRPWSLPASFVPALIAFAYAFWSVKSGITYPGGMGWHEPLSSWSVPSWLLGIFAVCGAVIFQIAGNLISDYYDFNHGVDRAGTFGSSRMLVNGAFTPRQILNFGLTALAIGIFIGMLTFLFAGPHILWIGSLGVTGTYFYYILKYHALGDLCIFIIFGILVPLGVTYSMTSTLDWHIVAVTAPIGLLIVNILHANNTRDIRDDGKASITTQAMLLGLKCSKYKYVVYTILAYAGILACCILGILPWTCVAVVLTAPIAVRNTKCMFSAHSTDHPEAIKSLDSMTAQLVIAFGLIQILAIAASTITRTP
ncbi:MAG: prenyltransferase [Bacteroidales bacterium]|nr:prenyltransferase [Bacteroidales bacterium]